VNRDRFSLHVYQLMPTTQSCELSGGAAEIRSLLARRHALNRDR
jgi:hypothetical protein